MCAIIGNIGDNMNGIWKTFFIYLPFIVVLMVFYWMINEIEVEYPSIKFNDKDIIYDTNYKYKTTLIPFIYDFTKEGRQSNYINNITPSKVMLGNSATINIDKMKYDITSMYIVYEGSELSVVYEGKYSSDITKFLTEPGVYRVSLYCKLHKAFYYDGYVDYKFKIEVL